LRIPEELKLRRELPTNRSYKWADFQSTHCMVGVRDCGRNEWNSDHPRGLD
jgi:hypothetical protein